MRIPTKAPTVPQLIAKLTEKGMKAEAIVELLQRNPDPTPGGRYRHWHKLQYLPLPAGLTHESWWLAIKTARSALYKPWPLVDTKGGKFKFAMPDIAQKMVHEIDRRASGAFEIRGLPQLEVEKRKYLIRSLREEAITSSQLEGAATTRKVAKQMLREGRLPRDKSEQMILNNYRAMEFITGSARDKPLNPELIFELHGILTEGTLADPNAVGRFRRNEEQIAVVDETGRTLHEPPRAEELPDRLLKMCEFANEQDGENFIHPVVRSILLHFWLAYDHPFVDGNGRTSRALFYWSMARRGYWLIEFTSISRLLVRAKQKYNRVFLYVETDENDATYFVLHQCRTILNAIDELHAYLAKKTEDSRRSHEILRNSGAANLGLNHRQLALIRHAVDHPGTQYFIKTHKRYHNVSYQTSRMDLLEIAELDFLVKTKSGREFVFIAPDNLGKRLEEYGED